uniref:CYP81E8 n=1 Tax=Gynostemma pentaphyllum TaxID=182084 RepID=A0A8F2F699_GYNPE|nr:CYP81E8 [Gynostemma pentaphyllum]
MLYYFFFIFTFLFLLFFHLISKLKSVNPQKLPPRPLSLPIIGHFHLLKKPLHRTLQNLSQKYGPILSLSFGSRPVIVISSLAAAQECFTKNDIVFANRPRLLFGKHLAFNYTAVGFAPYGDHWRNLRRITMTELLSTHRLNMFENILKEEFRLWLKNLYEVTRQGFVKVEMKSKLNELSFNIIMRMVSGKRNFGVEVEEIEAAREFRDIIKEVLHVSGSSNPGDFIPILRLFDYQGLEKRTLKVRERVDVLFQSIINRYRKKRASSSGQNEAAGTSMIDSFLTLQESDPQYYSDDIIKGQVLSMVVAGTDTTAIIIEWAMSLLLNHPSVMKKAWIEINECVGPNQVVEEADLSKLPYLQAIINESFRLFPVAPLLLPHESSEDCTIDGFYIPKGTMLLVNVWAINRDPKLWKDPTSFKPERFRELKEVYANKLIPFGMGRRACPGAALAYKIVGMTLAALIQCFEWERVGEDEIDMLEGNGFTMPKVKALEAMSKPRSGMINVLSHLV